MTQSGNTTPFQNLDPSVILAAVESAGFSCEAELIPLNSYENRVYQVGILDKQPMIVKFYRHGRWSDDEILAEHAFTQELSDLDIPAVAPWRNDEGQTLHKYNEFRFSLYPRFAGRAPNLEKTEHLEQLGRLAGRIHAVGALRPFKHRPELNIASFGTEPRDYVLETGVLPDYLESTYKELTDHLIEQMKNSYQLAGDVSLIRLHGDCHSGNILNTDSGFYFVDFDDSRMGPAVQDMWMCFSGTVAEQEQQLASFVEGYEQFHGFNARELYLIEALRTLRMMYHTAWLARRWDDPAFPIAFPWFADPKYWDDQIFGLREQSYALEAEPLKLYI
ncbi:MAG: serine/threonine protein kinase [Nitrospinota bacterium]